MRERPSPQVCGSVHSKKEERMFKAFMILAIVVLAVGWAVYFIWDQRMKKIEASRPKPRSEKFHKTQSELSDWAKKMASFQKPTYKKPEQDQSTQE
jgi:hypothetical protein